MENIYMNSKQISEYIGMCYAKTLDFIKYSGIKYAKIGRTYFVSKTILDEFLKNNHNINSDIILDKKYLL